jgi:hypothetical protein
MKGTFRFGLLLLVLVAATAVGQGRSVPSLPSSSSAEAEQNLQRALDRQGIGSGLRASLDQASGRDQFLAQLGAAFREDDVCAVQEILEQGVKSGLSGIELWASGASLLLRDLPQNHPLSEVFGRAESPLFGKSGQVQSVEGRFLGALLKGNQLRGFQKNSETPEGNPRIDLSAAAAELQALMSENPENGAYPFFLAQVLRLQGGERDKVKDLLLVGAKAPQFNSHLSELLDQFQAIAYTNAATFSWFFRFYQSVTEIDFSFGARGLRGFVLTEAENKWLVDRYSKKWIDIGLKRKASSVGYSFSREEFYLGHNLRMYLDGVFERTWKEVEERQAQAKQAMEAGLENVAPLVAEAFSQSFDARKSINLRCDFRPWVNLFEIYRQKNPDQATTPGKR